MKMLLPLIAVLSLGSIAHASWFQENCSNADGSLRTAGGHNENFIEYTERSYGPDGVVEKRVRDEERELLYEVRAETKLDSESRQACVPGQEYGFASWREVNYRKIVLRREDGSAFPRTAVGVSADGLTLSADLICELHGNSETLCQSE